MKTNHSLKLSALLAVLLVPGALLESACGGDDFDGEAGMGGASGSSAGGTQGGVSGQGGASAGNGGSSGAAGSAGGNGGSAGTASGAAGAAGTVAGNSGAAGDAGAAGTAGAPACDPAAEPPTNAIFVSEKGSDATGEGTAAKPFATLTKALTNAAAKVFVLAEGTYTGPFALPAAASVQGGWLVTAQGSWVHDCSDDARSKVVLTSTALNTPVVSVTTAGVTVSDLTVKTKEQGESAPDTSGESLMGVMVKGEGSSLSLTNVEVVSGKGGDGGKASEAKPGSVAACDGVTDCADGKDGPEGMDGGNAESGTFNSQGYVPGDGNPGTKGTSGTNGKKGGSANQIGCAKCDGASVDTCIGITSYILTSEPGTCGCGATAGDAGGIGLGGGLSAGVFVSGKGTITIESSRIASSDGGLGSSGALGAPEVLGGTGQPGGDSELCKVDNGTAACFWNTAGSDGGKCIVTGTSENKAKGGIVGDKGGKAGKSGKGGSGAGGPSFAIVKVGPVTYQATATTLAHGNGGKGADGAPTGAADDVGEF